jgi:hypothetical protein
VNRVLILLGCSLSLDPLHRVQTHWQTSREDSGPLNIDVALTKAAVEHAQQDPAVPEEPSERYPRVSVYPNGGPNAKSPLQLQGADELCRLHCTETNQLDKYLKGSTKLDTTTI